MASQRNLATLYRAADVNGLLKKLFVPDGKYNGEAWYDRLPRIIAMDLEATIDSEKMHFTWTDDQAWGDEETRKIVSQLRDEDIDDDDWTTFEIGENTVAEAIIVRLLVKTEFGRISRRLRTDFGVGTEFTTEACDAGILISHDSKLEVDALRNLITDAIHEYDSDERNDTRQTQRRDFMKEAHTAAARLLLRPREAQAESIRHAALWHLSHLLPAKQTVELRRMPAAQGDQDDIEVRVLPTTTDD